ncbi:hypothetical protein RCL_jg2012.t1 [Rhizophagus clarus]|uniref:Uncharacterized protein n=1 Tax=Rhizophagus clarus TaxID=94130 RepID=A0A8H3M4I5_9GLOM|nr:hypothetical protein RCL_jg2012.t1 [Rhizophagus clarus]
MLMTFFAALGWWYVYMFGLMNTRFDGQFFGVFGHVGNLAAGSSWYSKKWEFDRERRVRSRQFVLERPISSDVLEMLDVSFATEWKK